MTLGVKTSTSNMITLGECGSLPPSVTIQSNCLKPLNNPGICGWLRPTQFKPRLDWVGSAAQVRRYCVDSAAQAFIHALAGCVPRSLQYALCHGREPDGVTSCYPILQDGGANRWQVHTGWYGKTQKVSMYSSGLMNGQNLQLCHHTFAS